MHATVIISNLELNLTQEAILYFRFALQQARICKINSEEGIVRLSVFDYERENIRRTWWVLFRDYSNFSKLLGPDTINHQENQIFLPTSNFGFEPNTAEAYYGIEVMSSNSWYIPTPAGLEVDGYYMLILKIQAKMFHYFEIELSSAVQQFYYCAGAISASLNDWYSSFNSHFENANLKILGKINYQQEINWYTMYAALIYCSVRINLFLPSFMRNVIKEKNVRNQFYFQETVQAARLSAHIIELIMHYNPHLEYFPGAALLNLFPCGFFLLCCCKLKIENINHSYRLMQNGIKHTCNAFQKLDKFYQVLNLLEDKSLLDCVLYYGIFISRQTQELMERPASEYIDLFAELKINK